MTDKICRKDVYYCISTMPRLDLPLRKVKHSTEAYEVKVNKALLKGQYSFAGNAIQRIYLMINITAYTETCTRKVA